VDPRSHLDDPHDHALEVRHPRTAATDPDAPPIVHWPDPSPLDHWWTEVMDGALTPVAAPPPKL